MTVKELIVALQALPPEAQDMTIFREGNTGFFNDDSEIRIDVVMILKPGEKCDSPNSVVLW